MIRLLHRVGFAAARHPWRVLAAWVVAIGVLAGLAVTVGGTLNDDYNLPGTSTQRATDLLTKRFPSRSGTDARVVVHARAGRVDQAALAAAARRIGGLPHVSAVAPAVLNRDGSIALLSVQYDAPVTAFKGSAGVDALRTATATLRSSGYEVEYGGQLPENNNEPAGAAEGIGVAAALVILLVAFGSVVAAGLPLAVAALGLGAGLSGITLLAAVTTVSTTSPTLGTMVGLGVGVDYALFVLTRHRDGLHQGLSVPEAAARANATAGQSVAFAGGTVLLAICGLYLGGIPNIATMGFATAIVVLSMVVAAVTLLPALLGLAGHRVLRKRRAQGRHAEFSTPLTARWARRVGRRPLPYAVGALIVLLTLAAPLLSMRLGMTDAGAQPTSNTVRRAYDLVERGFGVGANAPLVVSVDLHKLPSQELPALGAALAQTPGVSAVEPPVLSPARDTAVLTVVPASGPQDDATGALVRHLRADILPAGCDITGVTAAFVDMSDLLAQRLPWVILAVVGTSFLLLVLMFRSVLLPLKAAVMNLLSIGAAYGVVTALFQWGWGSRLLGLPHDVPVNTFVPMLMFAILFGLSMDYEVFLLSRVREDYVATGDNRGSVITGLSSTARVITSAALIMVMVFLGFAFDPTVLVKMLGVGLATAVALDATLVRLVLVPATMALLGRANWWLPRWLDRLLPSLSPHGASTRGSGDAPRQPVRAPTRAPGLT